MIKKMVFPNGNTYRYYYSLYKNISRIKDYMRLMKRIPKKLKSIILNNLNDYCYVVVRFIIKHKYIPNLRKPRSFSEKLNYIKLFDKNILRNKIVDRSWVRDYVKSKADDCRLISVLWSGKELSKIIWDSFPSQFVIKAAHGSGMVQVINKDKDDYEKIFSLTKHWLNVDYSKKGRERFYGDLDHYLIVEEKLSIDGVIPPDFKFFCFNGVCKYIQVDIDRFEDHSRNFYDRDFNLQDFTIGYKKGKGVEKPQNIDKAIKVAEILSSGINFIRVDLYLLKDEIYFGELTNIPGNGFERVIPRIMDFNIGKELSIS